MHDFIGKALTETKALIAQAAINSGRKETDIELVAISKTHPAQYIEAAAKSGQVLFGENYIQEALAKQKELAHLDIVWHFTGRLQSNKAKFIPGHFSLVHTMDSLKLAQILHKKILYYNETTGQNLRQDVLIEVNLAKEEQKAGVSEAELPMLVEALANMPAICVTGLMLLPPFHLTPEARRPLFAGLRGLRDSLQTETGWDLPVLSMGMTDDFVQAIEEGATLVRVGTRIFGKREYA